MARIEHMDPTNAFAQLGAIKLSDVDIDEVLDRVVQLAKRTVPGAREVSVTLLRGSDARTGAFTGKLALDCDEWQYELGHGPCLRSASNMVNVSVPDMSTEPRWPDWARTAQQAGACSSLSIALPVHERVTGALNIYATTARAFDSDATSLAESFAGYAAVVLANVHLYETQVRFASHMQRAMESRAVIEQAKGILMAQRHCTPDEAFAILSKVSQDTNRKVRAVATAVVTNASAPPR